MRIFDMVCDIIITLMLTATACVISNNVAMTLLFATVGAATVYKFAKNIVLTMQK